MNKKLSKGLVFTVIATFLVSIMSTIPPIAATSGPIIYLEDPWGLGGNYVWDTETVPDKFNVTIWLTNCSLLNMFQVYMTFDDTILNITEFYGPICDRWTCRAWPCDDLGGRGWDPEYVFYGGTGGSIGNPTYYPSPPAAAPAVKWGDVIGADKTLDPDVSYKLARIEFRVTKVPLKNETLSCTLGIDNLDTYLYTKAGRIPDDTITKEDGYYELTWKEPAPPHCAIEPPYTDPVELGPWEDVVGKAFDIKVYIMNLHAAWGLTNATIIITYNTTLIDVINGVANITLGPDWNTTTSIITLTPGVPDKINFTVYPKTGVVPSGNVLVATVTFTVMYQGTYPDPDVYTDIAFEECTLYDHKIKIPTDPPVPGKVIIYSLIALPLAHLEVDPSLVELGPEPSVGKEFSVDVKIVGLHYAWYLVAVQFRLTYDNDLLEVVGCEEGPFLPDPSWNWYGTYFVCIEEVDTIGPHVLVGDMLLPNGTGKYDQTSWPNGTGTLATIKFKALKQDFEPCNYTGGCLSCELGLVSVFGEWAIDKEGKYILINATENVNGIYRMLDTPSTGRMIDVYGGATNRGYGVPYGAPSAFPAPFGGQGLDEPMDLVIPQAVVYLLASVKYNCWPVQSKDVGFEIEGPFDQETGEPKETYYVRKYANRTDEDGMAWIKFQMPWPCDNPEDYFGKYKVTATVEICNVVVTDILVFDYYYLLEITKVTTDKYYYYHDDYVCMTIEYKSKAQQEYPALFSIVVQDELETHFGSFLIETTVSGAEFCTWKPYVHEEICIYIPKWAFAGLARIYVSAYDKDPTESGAPWCPTFGQGWPPGETIPEIYILPTAPPTVYIDPEYAKINVTAGEWVTFTAIASGGTGPYTYQWYVDGYPNTWTSSTLTIYSASPGIHEVTVVITDKYGYTATAEATLEIEV